MFLPLISHENTIFFEKSKQKKSLKTHYFINYLNWVIYGMDFAIKCNLVYFCTQLINIISWILNTQKK